MTDALPTFHGIMLSFGLRKNLGCLLFHTLMNARALGFITLAISFRHFSLSLMVCSVFETRTASNELSLKGMSAALATEKKASIPSFVAFFFANSVDRKSTRLNSS